MSDLQSQTRGQKHRLVLQRRFARRFLGSSLALLLVSVALLVWNPPALAPLRAALTVALVTSTLILVVVLLVRQMSYVQCRTDDLLIQLPFRSYRVPYAKIQHVRPGEFYRIFPPDQQPRRRRGALRGVWSMTAVSVDLYEPLWSADSIRRWGGPYLAAADNPGLVLLTGDWLALRNDLDQSRAAWRLRQREASEAGSPRWFRS